MEPLGKDFSGSFNVYLDMKNWFRLFNVSESSINVSLNTTDTKNRAVNKTYTLPTHGRQDVGLHETLGANRYGPLSLFTDTPGQLAAQVLRVRDTGDGVTFEVTCPTPVR